MRGIIRSGDPDAIAALEAELAECEAARVRLTAAGRIIRAGPTRPLAALLDSGMTGDEARALLRPDGSGDPERLSRMVTRTDSEIRRIRKRLAGLSAAAARRDSETGHGAFVSGRDAGGRSVWFRFTDRPPGQVRDLLKRSGFTWSPVRDRWQRRWTREAEHAQTRLIRDLAGMLDDIS